MKTLQKFLNKDFVNLKSIPNWQIESYIEFYFICRYFEVGLDNEVVEVGLGFIDNIYTKKTIQSFLQTNSSKVVTTLLQKLKFPSFFWQIIY